ncbi:uncharacterized protein LOC134726467 [Mytilus trossulus]|uniref:uncharacterized protein LOC134726467 n=1 Tax=Mytilus trossulus TaxID=6551 RepID=UPI0030059095
MSTYPLKRTVFSQISTPALLETKESVREMTTNVKERRETTTDTGGRNNIFTNQQSMSKMSITSSPGTKPLIPVNMIKVTVITVGGSLMTVGIAVVVILLLYKRKRKRIIYHSRNSASNDIHASLEGEQPMQMFSNNDRSRNRTNTVPFTLQQKQPSGNISVSNYQDPVDMENQYQRLDFSMRSDLKEVHDDYAMQLYNRTSSPAVNDDDSKPLKKAGLTKGTNDLKEVYNNYSLPYDALSLPPAVNKDDMKIQIKVRPSLTTKDVKHNNVAYTAILR